MGQGASVVDILVLTFAATLILRIESSAKDDIVITQEDVEPHFKESFFYKSTFPLRQFLLAWRKLVFQKRANLSPFYLFSFE